MLEAKHPELFVVYSALFTGVDYVVLAVFGFDLLLRLVAYRRRLAYLSSWTGIIDVLAVAPGVVAAVTGLPTDAQWIRALRLFRFIRLAKLVRAGRTLGGITGRILPFLGAALAAQAFVLILESEGWWPAIGNLGIVIGVVGFSLAILLGTKLRIINGRLYAIEDAVCRIVGALRILRTVGSAREHVDEWAIAFERLLRAPGSADVARMRKDTDTLASAIGETVANAPNVSGFHRDVVYVLHRATARIPVAYEQFLRNVTFAYGLIVLLSVPGVIGFLASALVVYVIGGAYLLIEDMDRPFDFSSDSHIDVDLSPLSEFNERVAAEDGE